MRKIVFLIILIGVFQVSYPHNSLAFWYELRSPYPSYTNTFNNLIEDPTECDSPPPIPNHLNFTSIYTDKSEGSSKVDPIAKRLYKAQIRPLQLYERTIHQYIEKTLLKKDITRKSIHCATRWLNYWAERGALLDIEISPQGEAVRKWTLASLSSAYSHIQDVSWIDRRQKRTIESWLRDIAYQVIRDYAPDETRVSRSNNHQYWSAWAVMITGVVTNDRNLYKWALQNHKKAIIQIDDDGTLPLELKRQSKAFHYHIFAAMPLVMMAETAKKNGYNLYKYRKGRLLNLINFILDDLDNNQELTEKLTHKKQDLTRTITSGQLAWLQIYNQNYKDSRAKKWIKELSPLKQRRIGGNISIIYSE